jgi:crotonobetainyl-CoA:carnitine CoA-transferase CaiB-like acyl-CoA transferase
MTGAAALLACVLRAKRTGKGCDVDASLFDVALHQLTYMGTWYLNEGEAPTRQPRSAHYSLTPVQTFKTADGWIFVMCMTERFWSELLEGLARRDLASDERFATQAARLEHRAALTEVLDNEFRRRRRWNGEVGRFPVARSTTCAGVREPLPLHRHVVLHTPRPPACGHAGKIDGGARSPGSAEKMKPKAFASSTCRLSPRSLPHYARRPRRGGNQGRAAGRRRSDTPPGPGWRRDGVLET